MKELTAQVHVSLCWLVHLYYFYGVCMPGYAFDRALCVDEAEDEDVEGKDLHRNISYWIRENLSCEYCCNVLKGFVIHQLLIMNVDVFSKGEFSC